MIVRKAACLFVCLLTLFSAHIHAATLRWHYEATLSALNTGVFDGLGVEGESVSLTIDFDTNSIWQQHSSSFLHLSAVSASASITGVHSMGVNTSTPGWFYTKSGEGGVFVSEQLNEGSFLDFIIDGDVTSMSGRVGLISGAPKAGDRLAIAHLTTDIDMLGLMWSEDGSSAYQFINESITVSQVPLPAAAWLFGSALLGLGVVKRRKA